MKFPPRNQPLESEPNIRKIQEELAKALEKIERFGVWQGKVNAQLGFTAGDATDTNVQVETNRLDIIELKDRAGLPPGGHPGMFPTRDRSTGLPVWSSTPYATVPEYHVFLEQGAAEYYVNNSVDGDDTNILPVVTFDDDGTTMLSIQMDSYLQEAPVQLILEVAPHFNGETFKVYVPAAAAFYGGSPPYFILSVRNTSTTYSASVSFENNVMRYAGTNLDVGIGGRTYQPREGTYWFVQSGGADLLTSQVFVYPNSSGGPVGFTDRKFTLEVAAVRGGESWSAIGNLEPALGEVAHTNGTSQSKIIGKITAQVTAAPTGSGVEVMVYLNGSPILSAPLVVAAGTTYAEVVPDAGTTSITAGGFSYPVVVFDPGDKLTVEILAVGSTTPGTGLVVQALYG